MVLRGSTSGWVSHSHSRFLVLLPFPFVLDMGSAIIGVIREVVRVFIFLSFFSESVGRASSIVEVKSDGADERDEEPGEGSTWWGQERGRSDRQYLVGLQAL